MKNRIIISILVLLPVAMFYNAGLLELRLEEPRRALVAIEMMLRNSYLVPQINGQLYFTKPPLFNWTIAVSFWMAGSYSELAARMPGLLSFLATGYVLYWFARKYFDKEKAVLAALFFLTASDIFLFGTVIGAEIDLFFTLIITLQLVSVFYFFNRGQWLLLFLCSYFFTALGVLTKGVPAILFQGITLVVVCAFYKRFRLLFSGYHLAGLACFILFAGTYFYAYHSATGELYTYFAKLFYDATEKSVLEHSFFASLVNFLLSPVHLLRFFAPWFIYIFFVFRKPPGTGAWSHKNIISCIAWCVVVNMIPMLFTSSTKANYIYPLNPFMALLLAHIYLEYKEVNPKINRLLNGLFMALMILVILAVAIAPFIKYVRDGIPLLWIKTLVLLGLLVFIAWNFKKDPPVRIYLLVLFMVVLRLMESVYYLPLYKTNSRQQQYAAYIKKITSLAGKKDIYLGGKPERQRALVAVGPMKLDTVNISTPPYIPFQVPFYYSAINKSIMKYDSGFTRGRYYLLFTGDQPDSSSLLILNRYQPSKNRQEVFYLVTPRP
jgi:4-amino-4-deoxy-L-arabinose transferase-like glycosyltransferase